VYAAEQQSCSNVKGVAEYLSTKNGARRKQGKKGEENLKERT
jgi:hypothetical protein